MESFEIKFATWIPITLCNVCSSRQKLDLVLNEEDASKALDESVVTGYVSINIYPFTTRFVNLRTPGRCVSVTWQWTTEKHRSRLGKRTLLLSQDRFLLLHKLFGLGSNYTSTYCLITNRFDRKNFLKKSKGIEQLFMILFPYQG